ncbi:C-terminal processing protease CtpA/Prc [Ancylomarina subtilis]|uniref:Tricorn protease homolog n=1 Tax=Ancylomarina subtilis TaxID=1639035 RepID=A0A4Q7VM05_9BACT|nr:S41 family peptidase [Ancylomarina subtilis]RZT97167.1 C-terminal processing protease CtpA/Prc [Ancylomarina subtilis]
MIKKLFFITTFLVALAKSLLGAETPTWLRYPAISPDGTTLVFQYKGDIFKVDANGGMATALTSNSAYDTQPVWSPDGKTIAFASDRFGNFDIFTIPTKGGSPKRITFHSGNEKPSSFTPDGKFILFSGLISDTPENAMFPSGGVPELYSISVNGGRENQILTSPALFANYNSDQSLLVYQDQKGYENQWRKHHTSAVTRDIWIYDVTNKKHTKFSSFKGEDLNPIFSPDNKSIYYLSEKSGSMNIWKAPVDKASNLTQITQFEKHPVRFISISKNNTLAYSYNGDIYTQIDGEKAQKVNITINTDIKENPISFKRMRSGAEEMTVSPDGKEVAFIIRGEVFVTSVEYGTTKRITNTPEQERGVSFSPDGKALLYASERNGSWNLYQTKVVRDVETNFANSTLLKEEVILESTPETFQAKFSPDGKEVAFLEERVTLRVINLKSKKIRTILDGKWNYSYSDGDQHYDWSPDGKWFLVNFYPHTLFMSDVALVDAQGNGTIKNLTESGYSDNSARWSLKGKAMIWFTDKRGYRSHGSWGSQNDVYAQFFTQEAFDDFKLSKEERQIKEEVEKEAKKKKEEAENKDADKKKDKKDKKKKSDKKDEKKKEDLKIEFSGLEDRQVCLTINPSKLSDAILTPDGKKLFYLSKFEGGYDLWVNDLVEHETKKVLSLNGGGGAMQFDKEAKNLFLMSGRSIIKVDVASNKRKDISYNAEMYLDKAAERDYMFEHVWRQMKKKFYDPQLHHVDWDFYKSEYKRFLPHINNNYDYAEMLSELLGELNASHTGSGYRPSSKNGDKTANLGAFFDWDYKGDGLRVAEVLEKGPLDKADSKIKPGVIIEKIDGVSLNKNTSYYPLLNHKAGKHVLLSLYNPTNKKRWDETVKPVSRIGDLLYERWVKENQKKCDKLSNGKIGYVHVQGMNSASFRKVYSEMLGKYGTRDAIIVDTRFNGGGWLHDDLITLLSGKEYAKFSPRDQIFGSDPMSKWKKPSAVLINEGNYSDACAFPFAYQYLKIGKLIGMPVPGTMTAVWWETLQDESLYFGMPQVGIKDMKGDYIENHQIEPDIKVKNDFEMVTQGKDQQLEAAVKHLLENL